MWFAALSCHSGAMRIHLSDRSPDPDPLGSGARRWRMAVTPAPAVGRPPPRTAPDPTRDTWRPSTMAMGRMALGAHRFTAYAQSSGGGRDAEKIANSETARERRALK